MVDFNNFRDGAFGLRRAHWSMSLYDDRQEINLLPVFFRDGAFGLRRAHWSVNLC